MVPIPERNRRISEGLKLAWKGRRTGPWSYKIRKRGKGESLVLLFRTNEGFNDELFVSRWYPPWQNDLMRENAKLIIGDLNAAFLKRREADTDGP